PYHYIVKSGLIVPETIGCPFGPKAGQNFV
ncbi:MAG: hypothetical protein ACI90V_002087, partial [Bacillariaceae sp.]